MTPNKPKTKPIAADVKKVIAALAKHAPIDALLDEFRVKYDDQAFALLRWQVIADHGEFLHYLPAAADALTKDLVPVEGEVVQRAFAACGKGGVIEGSGPGLVRLLRYLDDAWLRDELPKLSMQTQLAHALAFPDDAVPQELRAWVAKQLEKGWNTSGSGGSALAPLLRRLELSPEDMAVEAILESMKTLDLLEVAPLLTRLPKQELLELIKKPASTMKSAWPSAILQERRERAGDSWEDSIEIAEAFKSRFGDAKYRHWGALLYASAGPIPEWVVEAIPKTSVWLTTDAHLEHLSPDQLRRLAKTKAGDDPELQTLILDEAVPDVLPVAAVRAPRFAATKERFLNAIANTVRSALEESRGSFKSTSDKIASHQRLAQVVRAAAEALLKSSDGAMTNQVFQLILPTAYMHLDRPTLHSILADRATPTILAMNREQLETYYEQWATTFPTSEKFFEQFADASMAAPPREVHRALRERRHPPEPLRARGSVAHT